MKETCNICPPFSFCPKDCRHFKPKIEDARLWSITDDLIGGFDLNCEHEEACEQIAAGPIWKDDKQEPPKLTLREKPIICDPENGTICTNPSSHNLGCWNCPIYNGLCNAPVDPKSKEDRSHE